MSTTKAIAAQMKEFGANIRRERTARGMTQERLAELSDLNLRTVQKPSPRDIECCFEKIEAGQMNLLLTTVIRLHRALACPWSKLLPD